ncbi:MAG: OmpA family protein [Legionella sp.]|nr:MAG: OmpA family protein [Legionella sp.]
MSLNFAKTKILCYGLMICFLSSCFHPPYNNFRTDRSTVRKVAAGTAAGAIAGSVVTGTGAGTVVGAAIGGTVGLLIGASNDSRKHIIKELSKNDVQYIEYGDTHTLVVPTDKYFMFGSPRLNELTYPGLLNIIKLLKLYPPSPVYVAGFTDNVGSKAHKRALSQTQAETMLTFLWANGIAAERLKAEGYADKNDISDNELIHGSAQNRRIEIQWFTGLVAQAPAQMMYMK